MRKTDKIANEMFDGNITEAIKYILYNYKYDELDKFGFEWTKEELKIAKDIIDQAPIVRGFRENHNFEELKLTKEEVVNAKVNPYKASLAKKIILVIIVNGGLISLAAVLKNSNVQVSSGVIEAMAKYIPTIFTGYMAMNIGPNFLNYFKFKKLKKQYEEELRYERPKKHRR